MAITNAPNTTQNTFTRESTAMFRDMLQRPMIADNGRRPQQSRGTSRERNGNAAAQGNSNGGSQGEEQRALRITRIRVLLAPEMNPYVVPLHKVQTWDTLMAMLKKLFGEETISSSLRITDCQGNLILESVWEDLLEPGMTIVVETRPFELKDPTPTQAPPSLHRQTSTRTIRPSTSHSRNNSRQVGGPSIGEPITGARLPMQPETMGTWAYGPPMQTPQVENKPAAQPVNGQRLVAPAPPPSMPLPPLPQVPAASSPLLRRSRTPPQIPQRSPDREQPRPQTSSGTRVAVPSAPPSPPPAPLPSFAPASWDQQQPPQDQPRPKSRGGRLLRSTSRSTSNLRLSKSTIHLPTPQKSPDITTSFQDAPRTPPTPPSPTSERQSNGSTIFMTALAPPPPPPAPGTSTRGSGMKSKANRFTTHIQNFLAKHSAAISKDRSPTPTPAPAEGSLLARFPPLENNPNNPTKGSLSTRRGKFPPPAIVVPKPPPIGTAQQPLAPPPAVPAEKVARRSKSTSNLQAGGPSEMERSRVGYGHAKSPSLPPLPMIPKVALEANAIFEAKEKKMRMSTNSKLQPIMTQQPLLVANGLDRSATSSTITSSSGNTILSASTAKTTPPTTPTNQQETTRSSSSSSPPKEKKLPRPPFAFSAFPPAEPPRPTVPSDLPLPVQMQLRRAQTISNGAFSPDGNGPKVIPVRPPRLGFLGGGGGRTIAVGGQDYF